MVAENLLIIPLQEILENVEDIEWYKKIRNYEEKHDLEFEKANAYIIIQEGNVLNLSPIYLYVALSDTQGKYVFMQTYMHQGHQSIMHLVRLPHDYHKDIVESYLSEILEEFYVGHGLPLSRYITAGGYIKNENDSIILEGRSADYTSNIATYNVNDVVAYLLKQTGLFANVKSSNIQQGEKYVNECFDLMRTYKSKPEFYSKLIDFYVLAPLSSNLINPSTNLALLLMKSMDRAILEEKDLIQLITEEMVEGIEKEIFLKSVVNRLKK